MEQYRASLERRGKTLGTDETRVRQPPSQGRGYEDWGSDFQSQARRGTSSSQAPERFKNNSPGDDSFARDDSDDELDFLGSQPKRAFQDSKASAISRESDSGVAFLVDGRYYKPHPDFQEDGKKSLQGLKFKKNKKEDGKASASSTVTKNTSNATATSSSSTARPVARARIGSSRNDALHQPFRPPTRIADKADPSRRQSLPPTRKTIVVISPADQDKTPRPTKVRQKPRPTKQQPSLCLSLSSPLHL